MRGLRRSAQTELAAWRSENEDLRAKLRDLHIKTSAEVAVWKLQAEGLEADFLKKANAEISIWKLDAEISKRKLSELREELRSLR